MITQREALYSLKGELISLHRVVVKRGREIKKHALGFGKAIGRMGHVLLECDEIKTECLGNILNELLGFGDYQVNLNVPAIENHKRRLEVRWRKAQKRTAKNCMNKVR